MHAFDVPFHQIDPRGKATLVTLVNPQARGPSSITFLQKSEDVCRSGRLLNRWEGCSWGWGTICALELDLGRQGVEKLRFSHSSGALGGRSNGELEAAALAEAQMAIRGLTQGTLAMVIVAALPVIGVGTVTRVERWVPKMRIVDDCMK